MDNQTEIMKQNWTSGFFSCSGPYFTATTIAYMVISFLSFMTTLIVMVELLRRIYQRRKNGNNSVSSSPTEMFLLQISLIDVSNAISLLLYFLSKLGVPNVGLYVLILHQPTVTAEPLFLIGICMNISLAVVRPVTYMALKNVSYWQWIFITFVWLYALIMEVVFVIYDLDIFHPLYMLSWFISIPATTFFNICTLRTLESSGPEKVNQRPNPGKRKALRIVQSILVAILVYAIFQVCYTMYRFLTPTDRYWFQCFEIQLVLIIICLGQIMLPGIFLYSIGKVGA